MATLTDTQDAYDRQHLHVDMLHADVADVIIRLEAERDAARKLAASETHAWGLMKAAWERSEGEIAFLRQWLCSELTIGDGDIDAALKAQEQADGV